MESIPPGSVALFRFQEKPAMLASIAAQGFVVFPQTAVFPLLPKHVHALTNVAGPQRISRERCNTFLSSTGNISSVWFRCIAPLKVHGRLIGALMLGERQEGAEGTPDVLKEVGDVAPFIGLAMHNHQL